MKLPRKFYEMNTLKVAKGLLGKKLVRIYNGKKLSGMIVETEAYIGPKDKASHSYGGKITERNKVMFGPPGHAYVYQIYGMYFCLNVVTRPENYPEAVLIRAVHPLEGIEYMEKFRHGRALTNGPGKLCQAMKIDKSVNGVDLLGDEIWIEKYKDFGRKEIISAKRIGIDYAEEYKDKKWRFYVNDNYVSKKKFFKL